MLAKNNVRYRIINRFSLFNKFPESNFTDIANANEILKQIKKYKPKQLCINGEPYSDSHD